MSRLLYLRWRYHNITIYFCLKKYQFSHCSICVPFIVKYYSELSMKRYLNSKYWTCHRGIITGGNQFDIKSRTFRFKSDFLKIDWIPLINITFRCFSAQTNANRDQLLHGQPQHLRLTHGVAQLSTKLHLHAKLRLGFRSGTVHGVQLHSLLDGRVVGVYVGRNHTQSVSFRTKTSIWPAASGQDLVDCRLRVGSTAKFRF